MHDDLETLPAREVPASETPERPAAGRRRGGWRPLADALMTAALVASVLVGVVGAMCLAADGNFGLGHLPAWVVGILFGGLSLRATVWVFLGALQWERSEEAGGR